MLILIIIKLILFIKLIIIIFKYYLISFLYNINNVSHGHICHPAIFATFFPYKKRPCATI